MPIDPSIALSARPVQVADPLESYGRMVSLRSLIQHGKMQDLQMQEAQRQMRADEQVRASIAKLGGIEQAMPEIMAIDPKRGMEFSESFSKQQKAFLENRKTQIETAKAQNAMVASAAGAILQAPPEQQQALYAQSRAGLIQRGIITAEQAPEALDANWLQSAYMGAIDADKQLEDARKKTEQALKEREFRETQQRNATLEKQAIGTAQETQRHNRAMEVAETGRATETNRHNLASEANTREGHRIAALRPAGSGGTGDDARPIADAIEKGLQPPDLKGMYRFAAPVRAELARRGYDLTTAQRDWQAVQKHISTLNGTQQERLRQAITFTYDSVDIIEDLYNQWSKAAGVSGFKFINKATLAATRNLPGERGAIAQNLESQINDLISELGTVYKGGNSSTDESLRLASENLRADWNDQTFRRALGMIRKNLQIRRNSMLNSVPAGLSEGSRYIPGAGTSVPGTGSRPPLSAFEGR